MQELFGSKSIRIRPRTLRGEIIARIIRFKVHSDAFEHSKQSPNAISLVSEISMKESFLSSSCCETALMSEPQRLRTV